MKPRGGTAHRATWTRTGINDRWPLWYDNYFVPRGYAVILAEMGGTANSTGCATNGGREDVQSTKVVIDWLGVVKTYSGPVSNDAVTVMFKQAIGATDALRTGTYAKTLTFTLSTTAP